MTDLSNSDIIVSSDNDNNDKNNNNNNNNSSATGYNYICDRCKRRVKRPRYFRNLCFGGGCARKVKSQKITQQEERELRAKAG